VKTYDGIAKGNTVGIIKIERNGSRIKWSALAKETPIIRVRRTTDMTNIDVVPKTLKVFSRNRRSKV
jgi:hypothetical protein